LGVFFVCSEQHQVSSPHGPLATLSPGKHGDSTEGAVIVCVGIWQTGPVHPAGLYLGLAAPATHLVLWLFLLRKTGYPMCVLAATLNSTPQNSETNGL
jgi:hypothetical protein